MERPSITKTTMTTKTIATTPVIEDSLERVIMTAGVQRTGIEDLAGEELVTLAAKLPELERTGIDANHTDVDLVEATEATGQPALGYTPPGMPA